ncbi:MAG: prephenate dehydratase [Chitinivibrionales bacterium]|nr:prephenate dehydratase [Chitinivibrionales bacterium]
MAVAFQGASGAFSELAANEFFQNKQKAFACPQFNDVFASVASGGTRYGIVPIENSMAGSIHQNYDLLVDHKLYIVGEIYLRITHYLLANPGVTKHKVRRIFSHPQALAQCRQFLSKLPDVAVEPVSNTAAAVKKIKSENLTDAAAIASMQASIDFKVDILAKRIEDNKLNTTRFLVLARNPKKRIPAATQTKTSIVFATKNIPGVLYKTLSVFALRDINLLKIESRPMRGAHFEYLFYLDFEGFATSKAQKNALNHLQEITTFYRLLGSYPIGKLALPEYKRR